MNIRSKLILGFMLCGLVPLIVASLVSYGTMTGGLGSMRTQAASDMEGKVSASLQSQHGLKKAQIERYFESIRDQILTFSEDRMTVRAMRDFKQSFADYRAQAQLDDSRIDELRGQLGTYYTGEFASEYEAQNDGKRVNAQGLIGRLDADSVALQYAYIRSNPNPLGSKHMLDSADETTDYGRLHAEVHPVIRSFLDKFGYYDIFLVDSETGDIVYSVFKELDFTTSLKDGAYANTNFGEAFRRANALNSSDEFVLVDFEQYTPSYEAPASFIASPVFDGGKKVGVAMFQMPVDRIIEVMSQREGLGTTGETVLVGPDRLMRSDSFRKPETHGLVNSFRNPETGKIECDYVQMALEGKSGEIVTTDYVGNEVIQTYGPVDLLGQRWCLLAKMDTDEAFYAVNDMETAASSATSSAFWWTFLVTAGCIVAILAFAWFFAGAFVRPINDTVGAVQAAANGDYSNRLDAKRGDELGKMGTAVNTMLESLTEAEHKAYDFTAKLDAASRAQAIIEFEPDGTIIDANDNFLKALGYKREEIVGKHHRIFCDPEYTQTPAYTAFWEKLARGESDDGEYRRIRKDGSEIWIKALYSAMLDKNGKVYRVVKFASDITEQVHGRQEAFTLRGVVDNSEAAYMMIDRDFNITYFNHATRELLTKHLDTLRTIWPKLSVENLIGANIDQFHKNPQHQRDLLSNPSNLPIKTDINVGPLTMALTVTAQLDEEGKYVGTNLEWKEVTEERKRQAVEKKNSEFQAHEVDELSSILQSIANGDLSRDYQVAEGDDDTAAARRTFVNIATAVNAMSDNLRGLVRSLSSNASQLSSTSDQLSTTANDLASGAEETTGQSATVAAAAEEMSTNMTNMAASTEEMTANVQSVAKAVDELTASIGEIAKTAEQASDIAQSATQLTESSNQTIGQLGDAAEEIGKVIEVIQDIAEQTNLLALNATIEAARAGEAGKGFAVVATEVKELARQTADATQDIRVRIEGIQSSTKEAVRSIADVGEAIQQVNSTSSTIASAVEEQSITTKEIASNVNETATATTTVSSGVAESASACTEISRNIVGVDQAAKQTAEGASQTQTVGGQLSQLADELQGLVGKFKVDSKSVSGVAVPVEVSAGTPVLAS